MKRKIIIPLTLCLMSVAAYAGTPVAQSQLPKAAQTFLSKYFPGDNVRKAEKDQGYRGTEYEVDLASGAEIDFRDNGDWKEVKAAKGKAVPSAIVPAGIAKYVSTNYKGQTIREISRKRGGYEVELSGGAELHLNEKGEPMQMRQGGGRGRHK